MNNKNKILTELPMKNKTFDYKSMMGMNLELLYEDEIYKVNIIDYFKKDGSFRFLIDYNGYIKEDGVNCYSFVKGYFGSVLKKYTSEFKYKVEQHIKDDKRDLIITERNAIEYNRKPDSKGRIYNKNKKFYKYTCNKCGWTEGQIEEGHLIEGVGCSCCSNRTVVANINSIKVKSPWMIELGVSEEDSLKYAPSSNKKIKVTCPDCGRDKFMLVSNIYKRKSMGCPCGDGFSYPEKFVFSILEQLGVKFKTQYSPMWANLKKYDFYFEFDNEHFIIETHGGQHYRETKRKGARTLQEEQENDKLKEQLAKDNGIENYIVIDCRESDLDWVKNSVLNSQLANKFNLSDVKWLKCEEFALNNLVKTVCDYWNDKNEDKTINGVSRMFNLDMATIRNYLKKGNRLGWCNYEPKR